MITHYFSLPAAFQPSIDSLFDAQFPLSESHSRIHFSQDCLFDRTSEFQNPSAQSSKITLTSSGPGVLRMISNALSLQQGRYSVSYVGESVGSDSQITYFLDNSKINTLILNVLAEQAHLIGRKYQEPFEFRLGALRQNINQVRPFVVDSTFLFFNINALKWSDAPAQAGNNPSGLTSEEANQLTFLAGQSHKNKYLVLYGLDNFDRDPHHVTLNAIVQMLWYYQFGAHNKPQPWPIPPEHQQDFTIESSMISHNLIFRKDRLTGNWFHKIPLDLPADLEQHQWISANYDEYLAAANDDFPHRLLAWYDKLEVVL